MVSPSRSDSSFRSLAEKSYLALTIPAGWFSTPVKRHTTLSVSSSAVRNGCVGGSIIIVYVFVWVGDNIAYLEKVCFSLGW